MNRYHTYTSENLFALIASEDPDAFYEVFCRYRDRLYSAGLKLTKSRQVADEIVQDCFVSLWTSRAVLANVRNADGYVYRVMANRVRKYLKNESHRRQVLHDAALFQINNVNNIEDELNLKDRQLMVDQALQTMTSQQRTIYHLARVQGLSIHEIASRLSLSPHTVKSHLWSALRVLRSHLGDVAFILIALHSIDGNIHC